MRIFLQTLSFLALIGVFLPTALFFVDTLDLAQVKTATLVATLIWFVVTPCWMGRQTQPSAEHQELL